MIAWCDDFLIRVAFMEVDVADRSRFLLSTSALAAACGAIVAEVIRVKGSLDGRGRVNK